jgi:chromosome segregation ATPase
MSYNIPQTSNGRLVSLSVDNPKYYVPNPQDEMPAMLPLSYAQMNNGGGSSSGKGGKKAQVQGHHADDDSEEKTMIWKNIASLFVQCEKNDDNVSSLTRGTDEIYQELQDVRTEIAQVQTDMNATKDELVAKPDEIRRLRKYVVKKCKKVQETASYGAYNADIEIFAYIDTIRGEFDAKIQKLEKENTELREELRSLHDTYDKDYDVFVERENALMSKLHNAVDATEVLNARLNDHEGIYMKQLHELRERTEQQLYNNSGDLREEFVRAITREVEFESKTSAQLVQSVNDELTGLITRSNEIHSYRYFGTVDEMKQLRENCQTLKQSIGMVDAELSDTKETVDFLKDEVAQSSNDVYDIKEDVSGLKDDIYHELDRDYYDLKSYVKRTMNRHKKQEHDHRAEKQLQPCDIIVEEEEPAAAAAVAVPEAPEAPETEYNNIIIIDAGDCTISSDDDEEFVRHT